MKKTANTIVTFVLGIVCCGLMVTIGVLAATNFSSSFMISLSYEPAIRCKIGFQINDGTEYTIYDNYNVVDISTDIVASEYVENDRLMINLGSIFENMDLFSADIFHFIIYNYSNFEISGVCLPIERTGEIENHTSTPVDGILGYVSGSPPSSGTINVQINVLAQTALTFNIDLSDD